MTEAMQELESILDEHAKQHLELLELEEAKRRAIIENDTARLDHITRQEEEIVQHVSVREEKRKACMAEIGPALGLEANASMGDLLEAAPDWRESLQPKRDRLRKVLGDLSHRSKQNADLLCLSLDHIQSFFDALNEARSVSNTYSRGGGRKVGEHVRILDQTA
jgi:hypothetical protein